METYECLNCGWILSTFTGGANASCERCGHRKMVLAERTPSWTVVRCKCGHKDVYAKPVAAAKCPMCRKNIGYSSKSWWQFWK